MDLPKASESSERDGEGKCKKVEDFSHSGSDCLRGVSLLSASIMADAI
jgi:hypothetical protein